MTKKIPEKWIWSTLGEICTQPQYGYTTSGVATGSIRLIRTTDITSGKIDWDSVPFCSENPKDEGKYLLHDGDIVISRAGSIGVSYLITEPEKAVFASYLIRFRPLVNRMFFKYFLESPYYWDQIAENKLGIAVQNVNATKLQIIPFPIPPLTEQQRIVAKIEELFSEIDMGLENLLKARELLKAYRQSLVNNAATGELLVTLGLLNNAFCNSYKKNLSKVISGYGQGWSPKCLNEPSSSENDWAVIKTTAIQNFEFLENENKLLPGNLKPKPHLEIAPGDILVTRAGPRNRVGISCLVKACRKRLILCDKAYRLKVNCEIVLPEYLEMLLNSPHIVNEIECLKTGINDSGVNLTQERFLALELVIPPLSLQKIILQKLQNMMSTANQLSLEINIVSEKLKHIRQGILDKAFSGELVSQEANDEPASILLERIKAEKEIPRPQKKKSKQFQKVAV